jgi:aspartate kinase
MAHFGAKVLHHKMILPAAHRRIPVRVRNTFDRGAAGTIVCSRGGQPTNRIKAIAHRTGLVVLRVASAQPAVSALHVAALFRALSRHRLEIYAASASAAGVTFIIEGAGLPPALAEELSGMAVVSMLDRCAGVCIIGGGLDSTADVLKQLREASAEPGRVLAAQLTCNNNLILAVAGAPVDEIVKRLHSLFIEEAALARQTSGEQTSTRPPG